MSTQPTQALQPLDKQLARVQESLEKMKAQFALALPKHMSADKLARVVITQCRKTPDLVLAAAQDPTSFYGAIMQAAQLGVEVDGYDAHLVPFNNSKKGVKETQLIVDYKGLVKLMWNSGMVESIATEVVRDGDKFSYIKGDDEKITHVPADPDWPTWPKKDGKAVADEDREITHAYAIVKIQGGGRVRKVMRRSELEALRQKMAGPSRDPYKKGPWWANFAEMCMKTPLRRVAKLIPRTSDRAALLAKAVQIEDQAEAGVQQDFYVPIEVEVEKPKAKIDQLTDKIKEKTTNEGGAPDNSPPTGAPVATGEPGAPPCAGCGESNPPPTTEDGEGRAFHVPCLRVLEIQKSKQ